MKLNMGPHVSVGSQIVENLLLKSLNRKLNEKVKVKFKRK